MMGMQLKKRLRKYSKASEKDKKHHFTEAEYSAMEFTIKMKKRRGYERQFLSTSFSYLKLLKINS